MKRFRFRSARTGRFVPKWLGNMFPDTTVRETVKTSTTGGGTTVVIDGDTQTPGTVQCQFCGKWSNTSDVCQWCGSELAE